MEKKVEKCLESAAKLLFAAITQFPHSNLF